MEWWQHFFDLLTQDAYFRAGYFWGIGTGVIIWIIAMLLNRLTVQWMKMRQFFEPIKRPGKTPLESGPSPAGIMLGCMGRILFAAVVITTVIAVSIWLTNAAGT